MKILVVGGSGFLSGSLARRAVAAGHAVTVLTRGRRAVAPGVQSIVADRKDRAAFTTALARQSEWDLVVDCIGYDAEDAHQDVETFAGRCRRFIFVSTDFVYDWRSRRKPQTETDAIYETTGYGGKKRAAESVMESADPAALAWTILRPSHIYGPGSLLGCLPHHSRDPDLLDRLKVGEPLRLVGGGTWLQQPIFADDLADCILSADNDSSAIARILNCCGPDIVPARQYYEILAAHLGVPLTVEETEVTRFVATEPDKAMYCGDRVYDLSALQSTSLVIPATSLESGLRLHAQSLTPP